MALRNYLIPLLLSIILSPMLAQPTQFRGSDRNGIYPGTGLLDQWPETGPELITTIEGLGMGFGSPSMNERGIYIAGMLDSIGYVFHFNHQYQLQWKVPYGLEFTYKYTGARGTPTLEENRLYYSGTFGNAYCLNNVTGEVIWKTDFFERFGGKPVKWGYTESPLLYQDLVILTPGGPGHNVVALDKMNGDLRWSVALDSTQNAYNSPVIIHHGGKDYILLTTTGYLLMIHPLTGEVAISHPIMHSRNMHALSPLYMDGRLFYSSGYGEGSVLFNINDPEKRMDTIYYNGDLDCKLSGLIPYKGTIFGTSDKKKQWVGVDLESGETIFRTRDLKPGSFLLADDKFFIFTDMGEVALAKPRQDGFTVISRFTIPVKPVQYAFAHPVIHEGMLYIRYNENLWLFNVSQD